MIALALWLAASAAAAPAPAAGSRRLAELTEVLRAGTWNERVHATEELEPLGAAGLPGLRLAAADADWQVRMTAAHLMGRVGAPAAADLARVLETEPCRHVRLTAVHWLGAMGPDGEAALARAMESDESGMVRLMGRYWLGKEAASAPQAQRLEIVDESGRRLATYVGRSPGSDEASDAAAAAEEDLKHCASSAGPGRAPWAPAPPSPGPAAEEPELHEIVATPEPRARPPETPARPAAAPAVFPEKIERERLRELDVLLAPEERAPESFPAAPPGVAVRPAEPAVSVSAAAPEPRKTPRAALAGVAEPRVPESFPPGAAGTPERPAASGAGPVLVPDAGTGKAETDPLPALVELLKDADPRRRARAADELGKRGAAAAAAVPALTAALKDPDRRVRASAALALGNVGAAADASVPALVAALKRGPEEVAWSAAVALGRVGTPRARRAFARYARQSAGELLRREAKP